MQKKEIKEKQESLREIIPQISAIYQKLEKYGKASNLSIQYEPAEGYISVHFHGGCDEYFAYTMNGGEDVFILQEGLGL